jgi:hypothetical protein
MISRSGSITTGSPMSSRAFREQVTFSPSDLTAHLECQHLARLELQVKRGELARPFRPNPHAELIRRKGEEHEHTYFERLRAEGKIIVEPQGAADTDRTIREARADVIYQPRLEHDGWRGFADFLERQPDGTYCNGVNAFRTVEAPQPRPRSSSISSRRSRSSMSPSFRPPRLGSTCNRRLRSC